MVKATYYCDECGAEKKEVNHWVGLRIRDRGTIVPTMTIVAFMDAGSDDAHLCGDSCLMKRVTRFTEETRAKVTEIEERAKEDAA